ncbi:hypothetical protein Slin15195_G112950 [Septoria linicola]|uniref:Uncharacterized protein n=1 Tax=Septoria linicola TaxID=215465 RepID=A0A9Q9ENN2_9PEZI|nr:hypothetical protein Slin15195_G112950 [Septoria linicola]
MSPRPVVRTCPHYVEGRPLVCQPCWSFEQATTGAGASFPANELDMKRYSEAPRTRQQRQRDVQVLQSQRPPATTVWYDDRSVANSFIYADGQPQPLVNYPYATTLQFEEELLPVANPNYQQAGTQTAGGLPLYQAQQAQQAQKAQPAQQLPYYATYNRQPMQLNTNVPPSAPQQPQPQTPRMPSKRKR